MKFLPLISFLCLANCAHVTSVSLTPIPAKRANVVTAEVEKTVFLAFNFDNDFIDPLVAELKQKCPNGVVTGILTKAETIAYVIIFTRRVTATGFCTQAVARNTTNPRKAASEEELQR